jgi:hypothetical protein
MLKNEFLLWVFIKAQRFVIAEQLADNLERKVYEQRLLMDEEHYLRLLVEYKAMLEGIDGIFDTL